MSPARPGTSAGKGRRAGGGGRIMRRSDPLTAMMLVFPLFIAYQVGVLALPAAYNGADLITARLLGLLDGQAGTYVLINAALALLFVLLLLWLRRSNTFDPRLFLPTLLESAIYALTMGSLILFVMQDLLGVDPRLAAAPGPPTGPLGVVVLSLGAGVHEELVFRLMMIPGFSAIGRRLLAMRSFTALAMAFVLSSLLFSAAHHVVGGEPWRLGAFVYRFLCGLFFATLFQVRGFAVAVYTHSLYDVYVLAMRG